MRRLALATILVLLALGGCDSGAPGGDGERHHAPERAQRPGHADRQTPSTHRRRERSARPGRPRPVAAPGVPRSARRARITGVADGDTVDIAGLGSSRLIGIDTPEVYGTAECFGARASAFTKRELAVGTTVYYLHGAERTDRYGRDLVYVWLPGGAFYNARLARDGFAVTLTIPPNDRFAGLFRRLAARARAADRGLWAPSTCGGDADLPVGGAGGSAGGGGGGGDRDCADFRTHAAAQRYFESRGGPQRDPNYLDADHDGLACEELP